MNEERCLVIVPVVHTAADMMSLRTSIPRDQEDEILAVARWNNIFRHLRRWPGITIRGLKVYQDGLPDTSEDMIKRTLDQAQSINYDVLRWLRDQGAVIIGTENTALLMEEYRHMQARYCAPDEESWAMATLEYCNRREQLLIERDTYMAQRIDKTLLPGEMGLLFIGLGHNIQPSLADNTSLRKPMMFRFWEGSSRCLKS